MGLNLRSWGRGGKRIQRAPCTGDLQCGIGEELGPDDADGATAQRLIQALCAELSERYDNPPSPFSPADTSAPRSVFAISVCYAAADHPGMKPGPPPDIPSAGGLT